MDQVIRLISRMNYLERELKKMKKARSEGEDSHSEEEDLEASNIHDIKETNTNPKLDIPEGITPCELAFSDPSYRFVASGKVHNFSTGTRVHTNLIPDGYLRVRIDYAIEENTPLPIPIEGECHVINDAIGTIVLWPIKLVVLEKTVQNSLRNKDKHVKKIIVPIDIGITTQSKIVHVGKEGLLSVSGPRKNQSMSYFDIYDVSKMYKYASMTGVSSLFGFLCPSGISLIIQSQNGDVKQVKENRRNRSRYLVDVFKENESKGKVFFAPYNAGFYWILCVIDPYNNIVCYLDSLHNQGDIATGKGISEDLREIMD
ncbi:Mitochondrial substrate carrier family protein S, partial [Bienertia sinuspersici]